MEELENCAKHLQLLDKTIQESNTRWRSFISSQLNYKSMLKFEGSVLPPPVVTAEKRRAMVMYRKQAYVAEVRLKSATREKDFLTRIQGALDEVRDFHIDSNDSSEMESGTNARVDVSVSCRSTSPERNPSSVCPPAAAGRKPFSGLLVKSKSTTDISAVSKGGLEVEELMKPTAKIHRRRRHNSEHVREDNSKPPKSAFSPSLARRAHSSSNILSKASEHHQGELSRARQRYRDERSRGVSPSPPLPRPASTPPDISNQPAAKPTNRTISTHALKLLMKNLDPSHDQPTHQWLASRVSDQEKMDGDISLDEWFQNAPDSVKQKLASLLPKSASKSADIHISPVHTCNSSDDTLRSTSPIPDEDITHNVFSFGDGSSAPSSPTHPPLVIIERSPNTSVKDSNSVNMADSSATMNSIDTVIEIDLDSNQQKVEKSPVSFPKTSTVQSPANNGFDEETLLTVTPAATRKRSLSMQSYTVEEPSEALLNFTHNEREDNSIVPNSPSISSPPTGGESGADKSKLAKHKTRIPTRQPARSLLSKCQLDTPSPQLSTPPPSSQTSTPRAKHRYLRRTDLVGQRSLTPTPPSRVITPTPPNCRPQSEMGTRSSSRLRRVTKDASPGNQSVRRILPTRPFTSNRSSAKDTPRAKGIETNLEESPLKDYDNREERISRARKQLALLKSKVRAKMSSTEKETETERKETKRATLKVLNSQEVTSRPNTVKDKENLSSSEVVKSDKQREDRPIKSVFLVNGSSECSFSGSILSVSSKANRHPPSADNSKLSNVTHTEVLMADKLHGVVKGHLCRRLLACTKVKAVVKTIKDCESLLSSIISVSKSSARHDMNFEQRIKLQMNRAKQDLHQIFFYMSASERLALVKQSEKMLSRQSKRRLGRREMGRIERRV